MYYIIFLLLIKRKGDSDLIEVEGRQVVAAHSPLLCVAAPLQSFVPGQEETHPGAGGGGRVLTRQEETNQHPRNLVIVQGPPVSEGGTRSFGSLEVVQILSDSNISNHWD